MAKKEKDRKCGRQVKRHRRYRRSNMHVIGEPQRGDLKRQCLRSFYNSLKITICRFKKFNEFQAELINNIIEQKKKRIKISDQRGKKSSEGLGISVLRCLYYLDQHYILSNACCNFKGNFKTIHNLKSSRIEKENDKKNADLNKKRRKT